jgi:formylglycine-generating enzyme required for sulfatase activity
VVELVVPRLEWIPIPASRTAIGVTLAPAAVRAEEMPATSVVLPAFRIARTPVTNAQYRDFVEATDHAAPGHWAGRRPPTGLEHHPVTYVDWHDATAFCQWAGVRLLTEAEWERAARGADGRTYPWGETAPTLREANCRGWFGGTTEVGRFPAGASPFGVLDMSGEVWEWSSGRFLPYPWRPDDGREDPGALGPRTLRGGSFNHPPEEIRCAARGRLHPDARDEYIGFRVATDLAAPEPRIAMDWVTVPAGGFLMGTSSDRDTGGSCEAGSPDPAPTDSPPALGSPRHAVDLDAYAITRTPVTNDQYAAFVRGTGARPPGHWEGTRPPRDLRDHPVVYVDWHEARAFCGWAGGRLPTEAEWEHAAAGVTGRRWPWGDEPPGTSRAWFGHPEDPIGTRPVDAHLSGATPTGMLDLAGNAWEWTSSLHRAYPYRVEDGREDPDVSGQRVLRGGSFRSPDAGYLRCAFRSRSHPTRRRDHLGFRVARSLATPEPVR